jgi:membrane-associated phospholipid phosphatase
MYHRMNSRSSLLPFLIAALSFTKAGQAQQITAYRVGWGDGASIASAGVLYLLPSWLGLPHLGTSCNPCNQANLLGIDRWAVRPVVNAADVGSSLLGAAVGGSVAFLTLRGLPKEEWHGNFATLANSATITAAANEWLKVFFHRNRPVMYTADAAQAGGDLDNHLSMPSMHASLAFAAAASYWVLADRLHLPNRKRNTLLLFGGAVGVGALRVIAAKHFPTDVLAGAALGTTIGWAVPNVHPAIP